MAKAMKKPPPLSRRYGYFCCDNCQHSWESAQVFCIRGTKKVYFRQGCKECETHVFPYKTERLKCGACGMWDCHCTEQDRKSRERHVDPTRPHMADLCDKCKAGYPCQRDEDGDSDDYDDDDDDCPCSDEYSDTESDETDGEDADDDWSSDVDDPWAPADEYNIRYERDDEDAYDDYGYYASGRRRDDDYGGDDEDEDEDEDSDYSDNFHYY